jgi:disulfide bond formation protein DsbB
MSDPVTQAPQTTATPPAATAAPRRSGAIQTAALTVVFSLLVFSPILGVTAFLKAMQPKDPSLALAEKLAGGGDAPAIDPQAFARGKELFASSCIACHGPEGEAKPGLGKAIAGSTFVRGLDDAQLAQFIKKGRDPSDPLNTTGIGMPAKGGNPALNDAQIQDLVAFMRGIQP